MLDWLKDRVKEVISTLLTAAVPVGMWKWSQFLPFLNEGVLKDLGPGAGAVACVVAFVSCQYARLPSLPAPPKPASVVVAVLGSAACVIGFVLMVFFTGHFVSLDSRWETFGNDIAFILFLVGTGAALGWAVARAP